MVDSVLLLVDANEGPMPQTGTCSCGPCAWASDPSWWSTKSTGPRPIPSGALDKTFELFLELEPPMSRLTSPSYTARRWRAGSRIIRHRPSRRHGRALRDHRKRSAAALVSSTLLSACRSPPSPGATTWARIGCGRVLEGTHQRGNELVRTSTRWTGPSRRRTAGRSPATKALAVPIYG